MYLSTWVINRIETDNNMNSNIFLFHFWNSDLRARTVKMISWIAKKLLVLQAQHALTYLVDFTVNVHSIRLEMIVVKVGFIQCHSLCKYNFKPFFSISIIQQSKWIMTCTLAIQHVQLLPKLFHSTRVIGIV